MAATWVPRLASARRMRPTSLLRREWKRRLTRTRKSSSSLTCISSMRTQAVSAFLSLFFARVSCSCRRRASSSPRADASKDVRRASVPQETSRRAQRKRRWPSLIGCVRDGGLRRQIFATCGIEADSAAAFGRGAASRGACGGFVVAPARRRNRHKSLRATRLGAQLVFVAGVFRHFRGRSRIAFPRPGRSALEAHADGAGRSIEMAFSGYGNHGLGGRPVLVTFNGKAFDWPLLENRFTMTRSIAVPRLAAHLDLLHPARALWKLRLGSVRLVELERHVLDAARLGWHRQDDVLAALIPQHYFDYLRGGPAEPLAAVVRHNQMDLRGLAALVGKIDALLASDDGRDVESLDLFGLSRFLQRRGESQRAHSACTQAIDLGLPKEYAGQARRELALLAKRRGEHEKAAALWHELVKDQRNGAHACEQLAAYYERKKKDFERALEFAKLGLAKVRRARTLFLDRHGAQGSLRTEQRLAARIARLQTRIELKSETRPTLLLESRSPVPA